jgi:ABC-type polysaccharide/polyol phosphate transport system ATPase subunit
MKSESVVIEANNLGKWYRRQELGLPSLLKSLSFTRKENSDEGFWALRHLNFKVNPGSMIGIVGPNGAGKSSLLGLVANTITPTEGYIKTNGRIACMLELGAGFHPDLSGRENIFLNASILGISREDAEQKFDKIVDFAGLREFVDMPVRHYSSGMYVRLAFSVAVEMNPDILLIDEVLAVGDTAFQMKCLDRIRAFKKAGKTILFVSHALDTVEQFCDEVFLLYKGEMVMQGDPSETIFAYLKQYQVRIGDLNVEEHGTKEVEFVSVRLLNDESKEAYLFESGTSMSIEITYTAKKRIEKPVFGFNIKTGNGSYICGSNTQLDKIDIPYLEGEGKVILKLEPLMLLQGRFFLSLSVHSFDHTIQYHRQEDLHPFMVKTSEDIPGIFNMPRKWVVER